LGCTGDEIYVELAKNIQINPAAVGLVHRTHLHDTHADNELGEDRRNAGGIQS
jgi:hypothetical protein